MRVLLALVIGAVALFGVARGLDVVRFQFAAARTQSSQAANDSGEHRADALGSWMDAAGLGISAREATLSALGEPGDVEAALKRRDDLIALLAKRPLSPLHWLTLSGMWAATAEPAEKVTGALDLSVLVGPNEGQIMSQRGILGATLWERLPPERRQSVIADTVVSFPLSTDRDRLNLRRVLADKSEESREEIRIALADRKAIGQRALAALGLASIEESATTLPAKRQSKEVDWFDLAWMNRRPITLNLAGQAESLTNYQVKISVAYEADMQPSFDDVRFTDKDGITALGFWREQKVDAGRATFWVKVPFVSPGSPSTLYMYYGNSAAVNASDGGQTFVFFDDFQDKEVFAGKWNVSFDPKGAAIATDMKVELEALFKSGAGTKALANDHQHFYLARASGTAAQSTIIKVLQGREVASFPGPECVMGGAYREDVDTLLFSSCGGRSNSAPEIWEMDKKTGKMLQTWAFPDPVYNAGLLVAYKSPKTLFVLAFDRNLRLKLTEVTIGPGGQYSVRPATWLHSGLGFPRGLVYRDGSLLLLTDQANASVLHTLQPQGNASLLDVDSRAVAGKRGGGLAFDGESLFAATAEGDVNRISGEFERALRIEARAPGVTAYVSSKTEFRLPVVIGTRAAASGLYPALVWMADLAGNPPNEANNVIGLMPHPNGDPEALYIRQRQYGAPSNRAYKSTGLVQKPHSYELKWTKDAVEYAQDGTVLGNLALNVPTTKLRVMLGGGTFNNTGFATTTSYVYVRKYSEVEPSVSFGEPAAYPYPERVRAPVVRSGGAATSLR